MNLAYSHVDVFSRVPFGGNSLPVFPDAADLTAEQMLRITKELRQFESHFSSTYRSAQQCSCQDLRSVRGTTLRRAPDHWRGGGSAQTFGAVGAQGWRFQLASKTVEVRTEVAGGDYSGWLNQGAPEFLGVIDDGDQIASAVNLEPRDISSDLPMEVVSTGSSLSDRAGSARRIGAGANHARRHRIAARLQRPVRGPAR